MKGVRVFGHDDNDDKQNDTSVSPPPADGSLSADASTSSDNGVAPVTPTAAPSSEPTGTPTLPDSGVSDNNPDSATSSSDSMNGSDDGSDSNVDDNSSNTSADFSSDDAASASSVGSAASSDELLDLKKQTIEELSPLLSHLDQSPEEKFRTTMMMIQATDSSSLIKDAHEAAMQISDEKERAQALLDIVNEINYFTHAGEAPADSDEPANE